MPSDGEKVSDCNLTNCSHHLKNISFPNSGEKGMKVKVTAVPKADAIQHNRTSLHLTVP